MTDFEPVVLRELDRDGVIRTLPGDHVAALAATQLVKLRPLGGGRWRLSTNDRVGAVHVGGLQVQIRPKVGIARLLFLLGYATNPGFRPEDVEAVPEPDLWPALAESLCRQVERALARGVLQGYVTVEETLPLVRGRVRVADQIAVRPGTMLPLEVRYDSYDTDIVENQIIRTALRRMAAVPRLSSTLKGRLVHLDGRLDGVRVLPYGAPSPSWRLTRVNARYASALRLAEIVLRNQSTEPGAGGVTVAAFVVSMPTLFEDFVTIALREALASYPGHTHGQYASHLAEGERVPIRPDVVHVVNGRPVAVFDAKYKLERTSSGYANADAYQMLAYCTALGLPRGWLVYAQGQSAAGEYRVRNTAIDIMQYPLDLNVTPQQLLTQIDTLAHAAMRP